MTHIKEDPRCDHNARVLGEPLPCQLSIRPIYPVRYSLTKERIEASTEATFTPMATGINDSNYDLRRLRQGYFYVLAEFQHVGEATDSKKKWLIFDYHVSSDDQNASTDEKKSKVGLPYQFTQYEWEDGTASGNWILNQKRSYPYAFVHPEVSIIHYAYSEKRWPSAMFELMEVDVKARAQVMQKVNLVSGDANQSFPLAQLAEKVADFKKDESSLKKDKADSPTRRTGLGFNSKHVVKPIHQSDEQKLVPLVVSVHDSIGNIADVSAFHESIWENDLIEKKKHLYATTTAKAVKQIAPYFNYKKTDKKGRISNGYPIDAALQPELDKYVSEDPFGKMDIMENISKVHQKMAEEMGSYTVSTQLDQLQNKASKFAKNLVDKIELYEYIAHTYSSAMQDMGISTPGMAQQALMIASDKPYGKYLKTTLKLANQVVLKAYEKGIKMRALKRLELELMVESVTTAQMYRWGRVDYANTSVSYSTYLAAFGLQQSSFTGTLSEVSEVLRNQTNGFLQNRVQLNPLVQQTTQLPNGVLSTQTTTTASVIVPLEQVEQAQNKLHLTAKAGVFLSSSSLLHTLTKFNGEHKGSVLNHPMVMLTGDLMGLVAAFQIKDSLIQSGLKQFEKILQGSPLAKVFNASTSNPVTQTLSNNYQGSARIHHALKLIGYGAGIISIIVSAGNGIQSNRKSDNMGVISANLSILAEVSFLAASIFSLGVLAVIGVVFLVGSIIYGWHTDNRFESWARNGFWGNSDDYWDKDREDDFPYALRLKQSYTLANSTNSKYKEVKSFFDQEMQAFYDLIWGIQIKNSAKGDGLVRIYSPMFTGEDCLNKLTLKWQLRRVNSLYDKDKAPYFVIPLDASKITKKFLFNGYVELNLNNALNIKPFGVNKLGKVDKYSGSIIKAALIANYPRNLSNQPFVNEIEFESMSEI